MNEATIEPTCECGHPHENHGPYFPKAYEYPLDSMCFDCNGCDEYKAVKCQTCDVNPPAPKEDDCASCIAQRELDGPSDRDLRTTGKII